MGNSNELEQLYYTCCRAQLSLDDGVDLFICTDLLDVALALGLGILEERSERKSEARVYSAKSGSGWRHDLVYSISPSFFDFVLYWDIWDW
jgi:hypothetical protein